MSRRMLARLASVAVAVTALLGVAANPVAATTSGTSGSGTTLKTYYPPTSCSTSWNFTDRWGRRGTFKCTSHVMEINWFGTGRIEYFGVAPDRTIWHSWATSGWWVEMPHDGRADDVYGVRASLSGGRRTVDVWAATHVWSSTDYNDGRSWQPWQFWF